MPANSAAIRAPANPILTAGWGMKLVHGLVALTLVTSSFDIFLVFSIGGATVRICQALLGVASVIAVARIIQRGRLLWPRGGVALLLWSVAQGILLVRSSIPMLSAELYLLLLVPLVGVFALLQIYGQSQWVERLMESYLLSFAAVAGFGLIQLAAPALHLGEPLIQQWIVHGRVPRINGFSYEPSYFATYMVMGWVTLIELRVTRARLVAGGGWRWIAWLMGIALFLSTSKTAWVVMGVEAVSRKIPGIGRFFRRQFGRLVDGDLRVPLPRGRALLRIAGIAVFSTIFLAVVGRYIDLNIFLSGTGINNTAAHSVNTRLTDFDWTRQVLREHPWVGLSLGGVAGRIGELKGTPVHSVAEFRLNWGFPVPVEVLAASGLLGMIPFVWFFVEITWGERRLLRARAGDERAKWLRALIRALIFEWICLSVDQNIVRMYLWFHVTIVVIVAYHLRYTMVEEQPEAELRSSAA